MLFAGWEVRIVKNCEAEGVIFESELTIRTDPKTLNNLFICFQALTKKKLTKKNSCNRYSDRGQG